MECYHCHKLGHFQYKCPNWEEKTNYAEDEEEEEEELLLFITTKTEIDCKEAEGDQNELLLMAHTRCTNKKNPKVWYLDSRCSNHMSGYKDWFINLNEEFRITVKLEDDTRMQLMGKGNVKLKIDGVAQIITDVYFIPKLKSNLFSIV